MTKHLPWIAVLIGAAAVVFLAAYQPWEKREPDDSAVNAALRAAADDAARKAANDAARDLAKSDAVKAIARDVARQVAADVAATTPSTTTAAADSQAKLLAGTWRDDEGETTYRPDGTFASKVDFRVPVPVEAYKAAMSMRVRAALAGTWKLDASLLRITIRTADVTDVSEPKLDDPGELKSAGPDAIANLQRRTTERMKADLGKGLVGKEQSQTIVKLDATTMSYKGNDGTVKTSTRVK